MKNVITDSGIGNYDECPDDDWGNYPYPVTFVVLNHEDYYIKRTSSHQDIETDRKDHILQLSAAIQEDELHYYKPIDVYTFRHRMKSYSMKTHIKKPKTKKPYEMPKIKAHNNPLRVDGMRIVCRNNPCPCGSGAKYKRCCGG